MFQLLSTLTLNHTATLLSLLVGMDINLKTIKNENMNIPNLTNILKDESFTMVEINKALELATTSIVAANMLKISVVEVLIVFQGSAGGDSPEEAIPDGGGITPLPDETFNQYLDRILEGKGIQTIEVEDDDKMRKCSLYLLETTYERGDVISQTSLRRAKG